MEGANLNLGPSAFSDTGQWKLIVYISESRMAAVFRNTLVPDERPVLFFDTSFDTERPLLPQIETAVYDHPRMLEDFATQIIIDTKKHLWIPAIQTEDEELDSKSFTCIYPVATEDISMDFGGEETAVYSLTPGLNSFLQRTLPGCKILSAQAILKNKIAEWFGESNIESKSNKIYLLVDQGNASIFVYQGERFLSGCTHNCRQPSDIAYHIMLLCKAYGLPPESISISAMCDYGTFVELKNIIGDFVKNINYFESPEMTKTDSLPVLLALA